MANISSPMALRARVAVGADGDQHFAARVDQRKIVVKAVDAQRIHRRARLGAAQPFAQLRIDAHKIPVHAVAQANDAIGKGIYRRDVQAIIFNVPFKQLAAARAQVKGDAFHRRAHVSRSWAAAYPATLRPLPGCRRRPPRCAPAWNMHRRSWGRKPRRRAWA